MRILVDQSGHGLDNLGDVSMLQVAVRRLQTHWPDAHIDVLAADADRLNSVCSGVHCVPTSGYFEYARPGSLFGPLGRNPLGLERDILVSNPDIALSLFRFTSVVRSKPYDEMLAYVNAVRNADLVVFSGGGYLCDTWPMMVIFVHTTFMLAKHFRKPTVLLGQGIGPLSSSPLKEMVRQVLARADLISLREGLLGPKFAAEFGLDESKVIVTGDDAIEIAYNKRCDSIGDSLGINIRIAGYSGVDEGSIENVRAALLKVVGETGSKLVALPIALPADTVTAQAILQDSDDISADNYGIGSNLDFIARAQLCRVVVTGSYHAAVFSLSQGIPVVGIAKSQYYIDKFSGLFDMFGNVCELVLLDEPGAYEQITKKALSLWKQAPSLRPVLLSRAKSQIEASQAAYSLVEQSFATVGI